ncbi:MAG: DNA primase [Bacilli bacterium]|nr:DNA primase [Bacilli bacterium]
MVILKKDEIDAIKSANNIVDVIGEKLNLVKKGKNYSAVCPFHDDHSPSMSVSEEKQIFKCFSCGAYGNVIKFIQDFDHVSFNEALQILADRAGIKINVSSAPKTTNYSKYYDINSVVCTFYKNNLLSSIGNKAIEYLNSRGINRDLINEFDIGLSTTSQLGKMLSKKYNQEDLLSIDILKEYNGRILDSFTNRIIFPIKDEDGNIIGFSGRIYEKSDESKYYNTKETVIFKKSNILYNFHNAKKEIKAKKEIILVEGYMDAIRLSSIGYKNVVAIMGTSLTKENLSKIQKLKCSVVLNLDQDNAGKSANLVIGDELTKRNIKTSVIVFDDYKDSDEFILAKGKDAFDISYNNKIPFIDFKLKHLKSDKNLKDSSEAAEYINKAIESINELNDEILKELKINELSKEFGIDTSIIKVKLKDKTKEIDEIPEEKPKKIKLNKYDISEIRILYLMLNNEEVITYFENALGYLIKDDANLLASKIISFKNDYGYFNFNDFIDYVKDDEKVENIIKEIMSYTNTEEYTDEELDDYFNVIKEHRVKKRIRWLKEEMKKTLDINKKIELGEKINNITKEVIKW